MTQLRVTVPPLMQKPMKLSGPYSQPYRQHRHEAHIFVTIYRMSGLDTIFLEIRENGFAVRRHLRVALPSIEPDNDAEKLPSQRLR